MLGLPLHSTVAGSGRGKMKTSAALRKFYDGMRLALLYPSIVPRKSSEEEVCFRCIKSYLPF